MAYQARIYRNNVTLSKLDCSASTENDETIDHLNNLFETHSLRDKEIYEDYIERLDKLGKKLNLFFQSVSKSHLSAI